MKRFLFGVIVFFTFLGTFAAPFISEAYVSVRGYTRRDGTYVRPHVRSNPNGLKYDNYSWRPSQGLYNKTYGTRGTNWDTPTYLTDPNYYAGKSIYDSSHGGSNSYGSTYTPTYDTYSSDSYTNSSSYSGSQSSLNSTYAPSASNRSSSTVILCESGTIKYEQRCVNYHTYCRLTYGEGYFYNESGNNCVTCPSGYRYDVNGNSCKTPESFENKKQQILQDQMNARLKRRGLVTQ